MRARSRFSRPAPWRGGPARPPVSHGLGPAAGASPLPALTSPYRDEPTTSTVTAKVPARFGDTMKADRAPPTHPPAPWSPSLLRSRQPIGVGAWWPPLPAAGEGWGEGARAYATHPAPEAPSFPCRREPRGRGGRESLPTRAPAAAPTLRDSPLGCRADLQAKLVQIAVLNVRQTRGHAPGEPVAAELQAGQGVSPGHPAPPGSYRSAGSYAGLAA